MIFQALLYEPVVWINNETVQFLSYLHYGYVVRCCHCECFCFCQFAGVSISFFESIWKKNVHFFHVFCKYFFLLFWRWSVLWRIWVYGHWTEVVQDIVQVALDNVVHRFKDSVHLSFGRRNLIGNSMMRGKMLLDLFSGVSCKQVILVGFCTGIGQFAGDYSICFLLKKCDWRTLNNNENFMNEDDQLHFLN